MVAHTLWLWLSVCWLMTWLTEAIISPGSASACDLGPCQCTRSKLTCDCMSSKIKDVVLKDIKEYGYSFSAISVSNCGRVHVTNGAISGLPALQQVSMTNIGSLSLEEQAFSWTTEDPRQSGLAINITRCAIPEVPSYTFRGALRDILLIEVNVTRTRAFSFSAIDRADKLHFSRVSVTEVEPQTFKKFGVDSLSVSESNFCVLPKRTMVDVEVHKEVIFDRLAVDIIKYAALKIHGPRKFLLSRSLINYIEKEAFHIHTRGSVSFLDNVISNAEKGSFSRITVERKYLEEFGKQELAFENNTLINFEKGVFILNTTGFNPKLDWIIINETCSCQGVDLWSSNLVFFSTNTLTTTPAPHVNSVIYCINGGTKSNLKTYERLYCNVQESSILTTLVFISSSIVSLSVLVLFVYCGFKERAKRYMNVPNSPSPLKLSKDRILVVPDGKTYRETELHVIVEHVEPIAPAEYVLPPQA